MFIIEGNCPTYSVQCPSTVCSNGYFSKLFRRKREQTEEYRRQILDPLVHIVNFHHIHYAAKKTHMEGNFPTSALSKYSLCLNIFIKILITILLLPFRKIFHFSHVMTCAVFRENIIIGYYYLYVAMKLHLAYYLNT